MDQKRKRGCFGQVCHDQKIWGKFHNCNLEGTNISPFKGTLEDDFLFRWDIIVPRRVFHNCFCSVKKMGGKEENYPCDTRVVAKPLQGSLTNLDFGVHFIMWWIFRNQSGMVFWFWCSKFFWRWCCGYHDIIIKPHLVFCHMTFDLRFFFATSEWKDAQEFSAFAFKNNQNHLDVLVTMSSKITKKPPRTSQQKMSGPWIGVPNWFWWLVFRMRFTFPNDWFWHSFTIVAGQCGHWKRYPDCGAENFSLFKTSCFINEDKKSWDGIG